MRYLVKVRVKPGRESALLQAISDGTLGQGSVAGKEYLCDMEQARVGTMGPPIGWKRAFARLPFRKNGRTGKIILSCSA